MLMHYVHHDAMSKLKSYLTLKRMSQRAFAARIGVDPSIISRLTRGEMTPSLQLAVEIEAATKGFIPAKSWVVLQGQRAG